MGVTPLCRANAHLNVDRVETGMIIEYTFLSFLISKNPMCGVEVLLFFTLNLECKRTDHSYFFVYVRILGSLFVFQRKSVSHFR